MSACEKCWRDASLRAYLLGGSVSDHYRDLLEERRDNPCAVEEPLAVDAVDPAVAKGHKRTTRVSSSSSSTSINDDGGVVPPQDAQG